jgi:hypothetical protein
MGGGLGALIKPSSSDPFGQATREEPGTAMPEDEPFPPGTLPVSDEVLHLLHAGQDRQELGIEATLHCWQDITALLSRAPDRVRRAGLGRIGSLVDAAGQRIPACASPVRTGTGSTRWPARTRGLAPSRPSATGSGAGAFSLTR